jgi:SPX domain protein involved in polyphosphate accumulation
VLSPSELTSLYVLAAKLSSFLSLNFLAVRKIVKKYDKTVRGVERGVSKGGSVDGWI